MKKSWNEADSNQPTGSSIAASCFQIFDSLMGGLFHFNGNLSDMATSRAYQAASTPSRSLNKIKKRELPESYTVPVEFST